MKLLEGKKALIFGIANKHSIAWGIAQAFHEHGAELGFSYGIPQLEKRVEPLAEELDVRFVEMCDVTKDEDIAAVFQKAADHFGQIDILVHSLAFAPQEELAGRFVETSRSGFALALDISAYSLVALVRAAEPLMPNGGSVVTMTYYGSEKVVPHYNVMGVAKAALEASVRYLAADLGPTGIRVNAISAGPIKTLAASGVAGFRKMLGYVGERAPLRRNVNQEEVGRTALWLCSDLGSGITGEVVYVDAGYHILGMPEPPEKWEQT
ncbi:MAG: enoyl-ACP reductase [Chloroflexi bacterium]|nr:enoyl-ACP reductase [Chloroflexota bacterium]MCI0579243.1 enoyl-ACP reductase [Chloroflexota bacterium]MCI0647100.1 enoyl-ACP reductase [Chloroflexota bacterium]MCI0725874.1 enoyl-ACP reductase [Chloroflexota bacterium]